MCIKEEGFLLEFLSKFNQEDKNKEGSSKEHWLKKGTKGRVLYLIRNSIAHDMIDKNFLEEIGKEVKFKSILLLFDELDKDLEEEEKVKYFNLITNLYGGYFVARGYKIKLEDEYKYFQKETDVKGLNKNIFIHKGVRFSSGFYSKGVHSYNHEEGKSNIIEIDGVKINIYIRSEEDGYILINYYELDRNIPISLIKDVEDEKETYKVTMPLIDLYENLRVENDFENNIDLKVTKEKYYKIINKLHNGKYIINLIKNIEKYFNEMEKDLEDISNKN